MCADGIVELWREKKIRAVGKKRAQTLIEAAKSSIGMPGGNCARMDLHLLLEDYLRKKEQLERITAVLQEELLNVPNAEKLPDNQQDSIRVNVHLKSVRTHCV